MDTLRTDRLALREFCEEDAPAIAEYMNDEQIARYIPGPPYPYALEDAQEFIKKKHEQAQSGEQLEWAIEYDDQAIGGVNLHDIDQDKRRCKIGYLLSGAYQRKGLMTEAVKRVLDYAFDDLDMLRVGAEIFEGNTASQGLVDKLGFTHEGTLRSYVTHREQRLDCHVYSLLRDEWK